GRDHARRAGEVPRGRRQGDGCPGPDDGAMTQADEILLGFTRALRAAGLPVTQDRAQGFLEAVSLVGSGDRSATCWAGRATLCASPDDLLRFDQVFDAFFNGRDGLPRLRASVREPRPASLTLADREDASDETDQDPAEEVAARASAVEVLRHRD